MGSASAVPDERRLPGRSFRKKEKTYQTPYRPGNTTKIRRKNPKYGSPGTAPEGFMGPFFFLTFGIFQNKIKML